MRIPKRLSMGLLRLRIVMVGKGRHMDLLGRGTSSSSLEMLIGAQLAQLR